MKSVRSNLLSGVKRKLGLLVWGGLIWHGVASAWGIIVVPYSSVTPLGSTIRFTEVPYGSTNPVYQVGPANGGVTVSFGSHFLGQQLGAEPNTLVDSSPNATLSLASTGLVATSIDMALSSIALGGKGIGYFTTPIAILFNTPISAVGFRTGHFDAAGTILFEGFDREGRSLGVVRNGNAGVSSFGIRTDNGANNLAGLSIYMLAGTMDWEGFTIDDLVVQRALPEPQGEIVNVPEPLGGMFLLLMGGICWNIRRKLPAGCLTRAGIK